MSETVDVTVKLPRPPEGMEWHDDIENTWACDDTHIIKLRPIVPATVMVEMTRGDARAFENQLWVEGSLYDRIAFACRAALARKPEPPCRYCGRGEQQHDSNICIRYQAKPCPVKVCWRFNKFTGCDALDNSSCMARRPCKHTEGHGGEHE